jgi:hypothetical protein
LGSRLPAKTERQATAVQVLVACRLALLLRGEAVPLWQRRSEVFGNVSTALAGPVGTTFVEHVDSEVQRFGLESFGGNFLARFGLIVCPFHLQFSAERSAALMSLAMLGWMSSY